MSEIKVHVVKYPDRANLVMRYVDPFSGRQVQRSAKTRSHREAERIAAKWEAELREGRYKKRSRMSWKDFRAHYSTNALPGLAASTIVTYESALNVFERNAKPRTLADVTTERITEFVTTLRTSGAAEATIAHDLRHIKAAIRWAHKQGLLAVVPEFSMPKRIKGGKVMRGRAISTEEFERMLAAVPKVVDNAAADSWKFYLRGLWASGLRLSESLTLRWDHAPDSIVVDFSHRRPMLRIPAETEKGNQDRLLSMTPDFATLLEGVSESQRQRRVFKLLDIDGTLLTVNRSVVGKLVTAIGKSAGVVVDERRKAGKTVRKFASAHDLRRAFAVRWADKIMPTVLRELMRHESIATTMKYYVGQNAEATADALWNAAGTSLGTTHQHSKTTNSKSPTNSSTGERT